mgnify:CR=1 FL=1
MKKILILALLAITVISASAKGPKRGFRIGVNTGYVLATEEGVFNNWNIDVTPGAQILPWFYVGGGVGLEVFTKTGLGTPLDLPIFGEVKFFLPTSSFAQPYIDLRGGYAINLSKTDDCGLIDATIGVELAEHFNVSLGYNGHLYSREYTYKVDKVYQTYTQSYTASGLILRVGYRF